MAVTTIYRIVTASLHHQHHKKQLFIIFNYENDSFHVLFCFCFLFLCLFGFFGGVFLGFFFVYTVVLIDTDTKNIEASVERIHVKKDHNNFCAKLQDTRTRKEKPLHYMAFFRRHIDKSYESLRSFQINMSLSSVRF